MARKKGDQTEWINFVKKYARDNKMTYMCAIPKASVMYRTEKKVAERKSTDGKERKVPERKKRERKVPERKKRERKVPERKKRIPVISKEEQDAINEMESLNLEMMDYEPYVDYGPEDSDYEGSGKRRKPHIQSVSFLPHAGWSTLKAKQWLKSHSIIPIKPVHKKKKNNIVTQLRYRIIDPEVFKKFSTAKTKEGINIIFGWK